MISLLTITSGDLELLQTGSKAEVFTKKERPFKVYRYNYPKGFIEIDFLLDTIITESQLLTFVEFDVQNYNPYSCGG